MKGKIRFLLLASLFSLASLTGCGNSNSGEGGSQGGDDPTPIDIISGLDLEMDEAKNKLKQLGATSGFEITLDAIATSDDGSEGAETFVIGFKTETVWLGGQGAYKMTKDGTEVFEPSEEVEGEYQYVSTIDGSYFDQFIDTFTALFYVPYQFNEYLNKVGPVTFINRQATRYEFAGTYATAFANIEVIIDNETGIALKFAGKAQDLDGNEAEGHLIVKSFKIGEEVEKPVLNYSSGEEVIDVTAVRVEPSSLTLNVGEQATLKATVLPENATDKTVIWASDNTSVVTVDNGVVTAVGEGRTKVIASSGKQFGFCEVEVKGKGGEGGDIVEVSSVTVDPSSASLTIGGQLILTATILPENATDKTVTWESSDETVVKVNNGVITATGVGRARVFAKAGQLFGVCDVEVTGSQPAINLPTAGKYSFNPTKSAEDVGIYANGYFEIDSDGNGTFCDYPNYLGEMHYYTGSFVLEGDNIVLTTALSIIVNANGQAKEYPTGGAEFSFQYIGEKTYTTYLDGHLIAYTFNYSGGGQGGDVVEVSSVSIDPTSASIKEGEQVTLKATVLPENATDKTVSWSSENEYVASVNDGVVTAIGEGKTKITATAGNKSATCEVEVVKDEGQGGEEQSVNELLYGTTASTFVYDGVDFGSYSGSAFDAELSAMPNISYNFFEDGTVEMRNSSGAKPVRVGTYYATRKGTNNIVDVGTNYTDLYVPTNGDHQTVNFSEAFAYLVNEDQLRLEMSKVDNGQTVRVYFLFTRSSEVPTKYVPGETPVVDKWPALDIANGLNKLGFEISLPKHYCPKEALDEATVIVNEDNLVITMSFVDYNGVAASTYATLEAANYFNKTNFVINADKSDMENGLFVYLTKENDYIAEINSPLSSSTLTMTISAYEEEPYPTEVISAWLKEHSVTDQVMEFSYKGATYNFNDGYLVINLPASADASQVLSGFTSSLMETYNYTLEVEGILVAPNRTIGFTFYCEDSYIYVGYIESSLLPSVELKAYPSEFVNSYLKDNQFTDTAPELSYEGATYRYVGEKGEDNVWTDYIGVGVTLPEGTVAQNVADEYIASLTGYTFDEAKGVYVSPNRQFTIEVYVSDLFIGLTFTPYEPEVAYVQITVSGAETEYGQRVYLIGDFCNWDVNDPNAIKFEYSDGNWVATVDALFVLGQQIECKLVIGDYDRPRELTWERDGDNRVIVIDDVEMDLNLVWGNY